MVEVAQLVGLFEYVRDLPYRTDVAHHGGDLRERGEGNCVAKSELLAEELARAGVSVRLVSWEYALPLLVPAQRELGFTSDVHTAVQIKTAGRWVLVDATHDPPLAALGLTVGHWDGAGETEPAYENIGEILPHDDPSTLKNLKAMIVRIGNEVRDTPRESVARYQRELNELLRSTRRR